MSSGYFTDPSHLVKFHSATIYIGAEFLQKNVPGGDRYDHLQQTEHQQGKCKGGKNPICFIVDGVNKAGGDIDIVCSESIAHIHTNM